MNEFPQNKLREWCLRYDINVTNETLVLFSKYSKFMLNYNEKVNLTAIVDPEAVAILHFLDSLLLLNACALSDNASVIDVGSGAGFPGVPLKIVRSDLNLTLLDSLNKRITFLNELSGYLNVGYHTVHARAEEAGRDPVFREQFDFATARAVASLPVLCEYCLPFVRVQGIFAAMKSRSVQAELSKSAAALRELGGCIEEEHSYHLPDGSERMIVIIRKISQTPTKYPRPSAKMAKKPL